MFFVHSSVKQCPAGRSAPGGPATVWVVMTDCFDRDLRCAQLARRDSMTEPPGGPPRGPKRPAVEVRGRGAAISCCEFCRTVPGATSSCAARFGVMRFGSTSAARRHPRRLSTLALEHGVTALSTYCYDEANLFSSLHTVSRKGICPIEVIFVSSMVSFYFPLVESVHSE
uniref:Isochorismatase domain-containing protein n=1 Tax=Steinernema glaseri TaxID=37863 RepID=A0A1I7Z109_9BILA